MKTLGFITLLVVMVNPSMLLGVSLVNGTFDESKNPQPDLLNPDAGLWGWSYTPSGVQYFPIDFFDVNLQPNGVPLTDGIAIINADNPVNALWQDFDVTTATQSISFQFKPLVNGEGIPETDHFKVYLWKVVDEITPPTESLLLYVDQFTQFQYDYFYHWSTDMPTVDPVTGDHTKGEFATGVQVDVLHGMSISTGLVFHYYQITVPISYNGKVRLEFQLETDYTDLIDTTIAVDKVVVEESAITLGSVVYEGDTILSTNGAQTASVTLAANLFNTDGTPANISNEPITFYISAEGMAPAPIETTSQGGIAQVNVLLMPGIYTIDVIIPNYPNISTSAILMVYEGCVKKPCGQDTDTESSQTEPCLHKKSHDEPCVQDHDESCAQDHEGSCQKKNTGHETTKHISSDKSPADDRPVDHASSRTARGCRLND
jgi:hypothetical protein